MTEILTVVTEEVEIILDIYKKTEGKKSLRGNQLKPQLIDYVMGQIQTDRSMQVYLSERSSQLKFPSRSLELRLKIEGYARSGLESLLQTPARRHSSGRTLLA